MAFLCFAPHQLCYCNSVPVLVYGATSTVREYWYRRFRRLSASLILVSLAVLRNEHRSERSSSSLIKSTGLQQIYDESIGCSGLLEYDAPTLHQGSTDLAFRHRLLPAQMHRQQLELCSYLVYLVQLASALPHNYLIGRLELICKSAEAN
jgi:hypothetical protein